MAQINEETIEILAHFQIDSKPIFCQPFGEGHINKTFEIKTENDGHYILQTVNDYVFKDVEMLMNNIYYVSTYLENQNIESLKIIKTKDDHLYYKNNNIISRVYLFLPNSVCFQEAREDSPIIRETAEAYGDLHMHLAKLDASKLGEVIPDFHNTVKRFQNFLQAVEINHNQRKKKCQNEIDYILSLTDQYSVIVDALEKKEINYTVTHNDPKINNVLFDKNTLKFRCVVDLDTVMPGTILYDFGDALRSLFTGNNENSDELNLLKVNFKIYEEYLTGYASKMKNVLTDKEIELLPFSIFLISIELGIRFLDDYLRGDVYFGINDKDDNLRRARTQITLAKDVYANLDKLNKMTKNIIDKL